MEWRNKILAASFAPQVRFHSEEVYYPLSAEDYIKACDLYIGDFSLGPAELALGVILGSEHDCYLKIRDTDVVYGWPGQQSPPVYVNVLPEPKAGKMTEIQYFFCYAYNGSLFPSAPSLGAHEGDWEHVTMMVDADSFWAGESPGSCLKAVYYAAHGGEGGWVESPPLTRDERTIVYCSRYNHACYPTAGRQSRIGFGWIDDFTDAKGLKWNTWENVVIIDENLPWFSFPGRWGRPPRRLLGENPPPLGPPYKAYFKTGQQPPWQAEETTGKILGSNSLGAKVESTLGVF